MRDAISFGALFLCLLPVTSAHSADIVLLVPLDGKAEVIHSHYICEGAGDLDVRYINAASQGLAIIKVDGVDRVFVNAISGSGARYVSGSLEWWSKGEGAFMTDAIDAKKNMTCKERSGDE